MMLVMCWVACIEDGDVRGVSKGGAVTGDSLGPFARFLEMNFETNALGELDRVRRVFSELVWPVELMSAPELVCPPELVLPLELVLKAELVFAIELVYNIDVVLMPELILAPELVDLS